MPAEASAKAGNYRPPLFKLSTYQLINYHLSIITYQPVNLSLINLSTYQPINLSTYHLSLTFAHGLFQKSA